MAWRQKEDTIITIMLYFIGRPTNDVGWKKKVIKMKIKNKMFQHTSNRTTVCSNELLIVD